MLTPNVSPLEATWTAIALLGTVTAFAFLAYIWLSYQAVMSWIDHGWAVRGGPRHKFVLGFLLGVGLLIIVWFGFDALGVNAMLNAPPTTPDRAAASERGGWILVGLEAALLAVQGVLFWAWVTVGKPTLGSGQGSTLSDILEASTDIGREMGHLIANDLQQPMSVLEEIAGDHMVSEERRADAALAVANLGLVMDRVRALHREIKRLGGVS